jgi:protein-L-isoaspartate O-methyltransferase
MVEGLRSIGIRDPDVLTAMEQVPRRVSSNRA